MLYHERVYMYAIETMEGDASWMSVSSQIVMTSLSARIVQLNQIDACFCSTTCRSPDSDTRKP